MAMPGAAGTRPAAGSGRVKSPWPGIPVDGIACIGAESEQVLEVPGRVPRVPAMKQFIVTAMTSLVASLPEFNQDMDTRTSGKI